MRTGDHTTDSVLVILLKEPFAIHTATSMAKSLGISRQGIWKTLNRLAENKLISLESVGGAKTSTSIIRLNWSNPVTEKTLSLILTKESLRQQRWTVNFAELENNVDFLMLFGSAIDNPKEANDIDLFGIVSNKNKFMKIDETIRKIQKTQTKKIHALNFTQEEFRQELERPNKAFIDAVKKGIILFGHERFIKFMGDMHKK